MTAHKSVKYDGSLGVSFFFFEVTLRAISYIDFVYTLTSSSVSAFRQKDLMQACVLFR